MIARERAMCGQLNLWMRSLRHTNTKLTVWHNTWSCLRNLAMVKMKKKITGRPGFSFLFIYLFTYLFINISQSKARTVGVCFRCMKMCVSFISQADVPCKDKNRVEENKTEMSPVPWFSMSGPRHPRAYGKPMGSSSALVTAGIWWIPHKQVPACSISKPRVTTGLG